MRLVEMEERLRWEAQIDSSIFLAYQSLMLPSISWMSEFRRWDYSLQDDDAIKVHVGLHLSGICFRAPAQIHNNANNLLSQCAQWQSC